jgi:formate dehydrogenase major subunit
MEKQANNERRHPRRTRENAVCSFTLNGREVAAPRHETLIEVPTAKAFPRLCYKDGMDTVGNCRACMVEIDGERVLAPSCCRAPTPA